MPPRLTYGPCFYPGCPRIATWIASVLNRETGTSHPIRCACPAHAAATLDLSAADDFDRAFVIEPLTTHHRVDPLGHDALGAWRQAGGRISDGGHGRDVYAPSGTHAPDPRV